MDTSSNPVHVRMVGSDRRIGWREGVGACCGRCRKICTPCTEHGKIPVYLVETVHGIQGGTVEGMQIE